MRRTLMSLLVLFAAAVSGVPMAMSGELSPARFDADLATVLAQRPETVSVIVTTVGPPTAAAAAARSLGARVTWTYTIIDGFAALAPAGVLEELAERPDVARIYLDRPVTTVMDVSHLAVEADKAWAAGVDGGSVTVAVLDTGIDRLHPFFPDGTIVSCVSTLAGLVTPECTDSNGHGTHVAGTVASRDATFPGVARQAKLAVVRVLHAAGIGLSSDIIAGMQWVQNNKNSVFPPIRVATMSIGPLSPGCGDDNDPEAQAANNLVASGIPFTVAAGNSGHNNCTIDGAAAATSVTTVAAVDDRASVTQQDDVIAGFSSGGGTKLAKPDVSYPGVNIRSAFLGPTTNELDGTSMATPHAAGTAALVIDAEPGLSAAQVKDRILSTAVKTSNTGASFNTVYGHGLGNACRALKLTTCSGAPAPEPTDVHVASVSMSFEHRGKGHRVTTTATVVDASGNPVSGATVAFEVTSPEAKTYTGNGTTGSTGVAAFTASQNKGGHGTWDGCVTNVSGTNLVYDAAANVETCDAVLVT